MHISAESRLKTSEDRFTALEHRLGVSERGLLISELQNDICVLRMKAENVGTSAEHENK